MVFLDAGVEVFATVLAQVTRLFAREMLVQGRVEEYARAVLLWRAADQDRDAWDPKSPTFASYGVQLAEEVDRDHEMVRGGLQRGMVL
eukprot:5052833-Lingulodinium_polyedra.AAC.1